MSTAVPDHAGLLPSPEPSIKTTGAFNHPDMELPRGSMTQGLMVQIRCGMVLAVIGAGVGLVSGGCVGTVLPGMEGDPGPNQKPAGPIVRLPGTGPDRTDGA